MSEVETQTVRLRVTASPMWLNAVLPRAVARSCDAYPAVEFELKGAGQLETDGHVVPARGTGGLFPVKPRVTLDPGLSLFLTRGLTGTG